MMLAQMASFSDTGGASGRLLEAVLGRLEPLLEGLGPEALPLFRVGWAFAIGLSVGMVVTLLYRLLLPTPTTSRRKLVRRVKEAERPVPRAPQAPQATPPAATGAGMDYFQTQADAMSLTPGRSRSHIPKLQGMQRLRRRLTSKRGGKRGAPTAVGVEASPGPETKAPAARQGSAHASHSAWMEGLPIALRRDAEVVLRAITPETCGMDAVRAIFMQAAGDPERETPDKSSLNALELETDEMGVPLGYRRQLELLHSGDIVRYVNARAADTEGAARQLARDLLWRARRAVVESSATPKKREGRPLRPRWWPVPDAILDMGIFRLCGHDRQGRPVLIIKGGKWRPGAYAEHEEECFASATMDTLQERMRLAEPAEYAQGTPRCQTWTVLFDLSDWTRANSDRATLRRFIGLLLHHYPERLGAAIILDAPWLFSTMWSVINGFLEEKTRQKIQFMRQPRGPGAELNPKLAELIDPAQLEKSLGGSRPEDYPPMPEEGYADGSQ